jgi:hypothetical protein
MPLYDYRCEEGHVTEGTYPVHVAVVSCPCGRLAARVAVNRGHMPGVSGFVPTPTREHRLRLSHAIEAQHEIIHTAERHGVQAPDLWAAAQARIARGDVKAIE